MLIERAYLQKGHGESIEGSKSARQPILLRISPEIGGKMRGLVCKRKNDIPVDGEVGL